MDFVLLLLTNTTYYYYYTHGTNLPSTTGCKKNAIMGRRQDNVAPISRLKSL